MDWASKNCLMFFGLIETRVKNCNFKGCFYTFSKRWQCLHNGDISNSGRIWSLWDVEYVDISPILITDQLIHVKVMVKNTILVFEATVVYGANFEPDRRDLWSNLRSLRANIAHPWVTLGDFNSICHPSEKLGGRPVTYNMMQPLADFFQNPAVSDHSPMVVTLEEVPARRGRRFYFFNHWADHVDFLPLVVEVWRQPTTSTPIFALMYRLKLLKRRLKFWSRRTNHSLDKRVDELSCELDQLQSRLNTVDTDPDVMEQEKQCSFSLRRLLNVRESELRQKARVRWLNLGDSNTDFFHRALKSRSRNQIVSIHSADGVLLQDEESIRFEAARHFESAFMGSPQVVCEPFDLPVDRSLDSFEADLLAKDFTREEIKAVVFSANDDSSPGTDGFGACFFKKAWCIIGNDVCDAIWDFFNNLNIPDQVKLSRLTLVPKGDLQVTFNDFWPIALLHGYHVNKGMPRFAAKLDLRKAYDSVQWSFLFTLLYKLNFSPSFINWISRCIVNPGYVVFLNGAQSPKFSANRGLR
ncbi:uncharacterized protein LOC122643360 [Telopea speciosissima]|uniref:uncharacterized protein LOC122643360 n=1 Tax=Telopea speciosissima TaxID=54955 RepID=UPI001CC5243F|nr:uncharacterized protein LOC122643360 [Telopea speciosissima]